MTPRIKILRSTYVAVVAALLATSAAAQVHQRDPAYAAARAAGQVGEKVDGYLGMVGSQGADIKKLVDDINIKRKAVYFTKAQEKRVTPDEYAFTTGCINMGNLQAGEKYQAPDGSWQTKGAGPAVKHSSCP